MNRIIELKPNQNTLAGQYRPGDTVLVKCDATNAAFSILIPDAKSVRDVIFYIKKTDSTSNVVTLTAYNTQTFDGDTTITINSQYDSVGLVSDYDIYYKIDFFVDEGEYLLRDGSRELTADWDAGPYKITHKDLALTGTIGVGKAPTSDIKIDVEDLTINTSGTLYGLKLNQEKTDGGTNYLDRAFGIDNVLTYNDAQEIGHVYGMRNLVIIEAGTVGRVGGNERMVWGLDNFVRVESGATATSDVFGLRSRSDINSGATVSDVYGQHILVDNDATVRNGTTYMLYLQESSNIDFGIYQNGVAPSLFGGDINIDSDTSGLILGDLQSSSIVDDGSDMVFDCDLNSGTGRKFIFQNGDFQFNNASRFAWKKIIANSVTLDVGTSGELVADLQTAFDGNTYDITEATGTPGIDLKVDFISVVSFNWIHILAYYDGASMHSISIQLYNWSTTVWNTFDSQTGTEKTMHDHSFFVPDETNYIGTGGDAGKVRVRFNHTMAGNASHDLYIEVVALYQ